MSITAAIKAMPKLVRNAAVTRGSTSMATKPFQPIPAARSTKAQSGSSTMKDR
jgi:hypothetical protein